jgi:hypothetical protein
LAQEHPSFSFPFLYISLAISISLTISISLPISISSLSLSPSITKKKNIQNVGEQFAAFCLFMGTSPKNSKKCGLLGGNENTLKLKTTAKLKLKDKRTSIATVRGLYRMHATFPTPLGSQYRLKNDG